MTAPPRFTDTEIIDVINGTGLRGAVLRSSTEDYDCLDVLIPHRPGHAYRFQRDLHGWTYLLIVDQAELVLLELGTLAECLGFFQPVTA